MSSQPEKTTDIFSIHLQQRIKEIDGSITIKNCDQDYNKEKWVSRVSYLNSEIIKNFQQPICLISREKLPDTEAQSEEHIILQGLGTKWIYLPPGFVNDKINNQMCSDEDNFLNKGLMGALRPFYLTKKKSVSFEHNGQKVELINDPEKGFLIDVEVFQKTNFYKNNGSGTISFRVPVKEPNPLSVSRAIHKIAYLSLCVHQPQLIIRDLFYNVRQLILQGTTETYRPYQEMFLPGQWPGFNISFFVDCVALDANHLVVINLWTILHLHHMVYNINLLGHQDHIFQEFANFQYYPQAKSHHKIRWVDLSFGFDKLQLKP